MSIELSYPATASDFSIEWMNAALASHLGDNHITIVSAHQSDIPGQTAEIIKVAVEYANETDLPSELIAKVTSQDPAILENLIPNYDQYRRETSFYREFPDVGISTPQCLYEAYNPENFDFVLLMADLAPADCPSWAISPDQVTLALSALPAFHAKWWQSDFLRSRDYLVQFDDAAFFGVAFAAAKQGSDGLTQHYEDPGLTQEVMSYAAANTEKLLKFMASRPFTLVHGDYHAKQMFFPTKNGGEFAVIDWQFPFVAQGPWDFARMIGMGLDSSECETRETYLLQEYLKGLSDHGINDYAFDDLILDYSFGLFISQMIMSIAHGDTDVTIFEKECDALGVDWRDAMLLRTQRLLDKWNVLDKLKQL